MHFPVEHPLQRTNRKEPYSLPPFHTTSPGRITKKKNKMKKIHFGLSPNYWDLNIGITRHQVDFMQGRVDPERAKVDAGTSWQSLGRVDWTAKKSAFSIGHGMFFSKTHQHIWKKLHCQCYAWILPIFLFFKFKTNLNLNQTYFENISQSVYLALWLWW